jgi:hypothetical protein
VTLTLSANLSLEPLGGAGKAPQVMLERFALFGIEGRRDVAVRCVGGGVARRVGPAVTPP